MSGRRLPADRPPRRNREGGFTFAEILVTLVFLSIAILAVTSQFPVGLQVSQTAEDLTLCTNLAQEMLEEIRTMSWHDPFDASTSLGPNAGETSRLLFNDVDDYNGLNEDPPVDLDGNTMDGSGSTPNFGRYIRSVSVSYADTVTLAATGSVTPYKRVEVTVTNRTSGTNAFLYLILAMQP